jgi:hypothetical protein
LRQLFSIDLEEGQQREMGLLNTKLTDPLSAFAGETVKCPN